MFKIHKPQMSGSIHSGHFMVSRLDDDEDEDNNDPADDSSESERDNAQSVEIDIHNPDSVADAAKNLEIPYPSTKNEQVTSWNDLDRPTKRLQKQNQYLTYYTNTSSTYSSSSNDNNTAGNSNDQLIDARLISSANGLRQATSSTSNDSNTPLAATNLVVNQSSQQNRTAQNGFSITTAATTSMAPPAIPRTTSLDHSSSAAAAFLSEASRQLAQDRHQLVQHQQMGNVPYQIQDQQQQQQLQLVATRQQMQLAAAAAANMAHGQHAHQVTIDTSLTKLLQCRRPPGCQFVAPVETDVHKKTETIVLEGKYWKRKEKAIADEYKKWRIFNIHKQKNQLHCFRPSSFDWDSRASNLASSAGPDYHFYPDYDMSIPYNLDEMPMLEELEHQQNQSNQETYYQMQPPQTPQHQQPTQLPHHQQHSQAQQQHQQLPQQQMETITNPPGHLHSASSYVHHQQQQHQQQQQSAANQVPPTHPQQHQHQHPINPSVRNTFPQSANSMPTFSIDNNAIYQQIQQQNQQQLDLSQREQDDHLMSMEQDMDMSSGSSTSGRHEQRRVCHINAEQKRRCNIKNGFDTLRSILPSVNQNVNFKISKASMLQKAAVHISNLSSEQKQQADERSILKQQIDSLKQTINDYQSQLPASGSSSNNQNVANNGTSRAREMLQEYIRQRTLDNWKFWIFSLLVEPLFQTYYQTVNTSSLEDACKTIFGWLDQSCGLVTLRKDALESLTFLSTSTNILQTPHTLPTEAVDAVKYSNGNSSNQQDPQQTTPPSSRQLQMIPNLLQPSAVATSSVAHNATLNSSTINTTPMVLTRQGSVLQGTHLQHLHLQQHQSHLQSAQSIQALPPSTVQQPQVLQHAQQHQLQQQQQQVMNVPPNAMHAHTIRTPW